MQTHREPLTLPLTSHWRAFSMGCFNLFQVLCLQFHTPPYPSHKRITLAGTVIVKQHSCKHRKPYPSHTHMHHFANGPSLSNRRHVLTADPWTRNIGAVHATRLLEKLDTKTSVLICVRWKPEQRSYVFHIATELYWNSQLALYTGLTEQLSFRCVSPSTLSDLLLLSILGWWFLRYRQLVWQ